MNTIKKTLENTLLDAPIEVGGWVRTKRCSKTTLFIDLQDGSLLRPLQLVGAPHLISDELQGRITPGSSIRVKGILRASRGGQEQQKEVEIQKIDLVGDCPTTYPLQPKRHSLEFLRTLQHLRFRSNTFRAIFRIRHQVCRAIHQFFDQREFYYVHTPIITQIDAEGAGTLFQLANRLGDEKPFFGKPAYLTVSGQLAGEAAALGMGKIYTFGPTFRAENSNTTRHLAEFWMVEPELIFCDLAALTELAESFVKSVVGHIAHSCQEEIALLTRQEQYKKQPSAIPLQERLEKISTQPFVRITYTEAIGLLKGTSNFQYPVKEWGINLQKEHEQFLVDHFDAPVIVTDYPQAIKAFYMRQNTDAKTVAAMDLLVPGIGELIGGSQREERYDRLVSAMKAHKISSDQMSWYVDTRRFGSVPHSGFGLGLERLVQLVTGMENIRDVIPFPRTPGHAEG